MENLQVGRVVITLSKARTKNQNERIELSLPNGEIIVVAISELRCNQVRLVFQANKNIKINRVYDGPTSKSESSET